jgi:outer membrane protein assembly factor BamB
LLPDAAGSVSQPHLMMGAAKNGSLYVLNRDSLGQLSSSCPDAAIRAQVVPIGDGPILSTPLFWNNAIYIAAGNGALKAFPIHGGILSSSPLSAKSPETLGPQGATPAVSSNGTNNAIVWLIDSSGAFASPNTPSILRAFDASNLSNEVYNSAMVPSRDIAGLAVKFSVPTVANGKVYVGTQSELDVYGLLY